MSLRRGLSHFDLIRKKCRLFESTTMDSVRHILMGRNGDYFLNYNDYSKTFIAVPKLPPLSYLR